MKYWIVKKYFEIKQKKGKEYAKKIRKKMEEILKKMVEGEGAEWENFAKKCNIEIKRKQYSYKRKITKKDIKKLFAAAETKRQLFILVLTVFTGARTSELKNIQIEVKDEKIVFSIKRTKGKKEKEKKITKVAYSVNEFIRIYKEIVPSKKKINIFKELKKIRKISERTIEREMQRISKRAGFRKTITVHHIRNFFSEQLRKVHQDPFVIAKALGHSQIKTQRFYAKRYKGDIILPRPKISANFEPKGEIEIQQYFAFSPQPEQDI